MKTQRFARLLRQWMQHRRFRRDLDAAKELGLERSVFTKYRNADIVPSFDKAFDLIESMGGQLERLLPWTNAPFDEVAPETDLPAASNGNSAQRPGPPEDWRLWPVVGEVEEDSSRLLFYHTYDDYLPDMEPLFRRTPTWDKGFGVPGFVRVVVGGRPARLGDQVIHFAIRQIDHRVRIEEGPQGKIYAVARIVPTGEHFFGIWTRAYRAGFYVFQPAARGRGTGEQEVEKHAWSEHDVEFTHVVLGTATYSTNDPELDWSAGAVAGGGPQRRV